MISIKFVSLLTLVSVAVAQNLTQDKIAKAEAVDLELARPLPLGPCFGKYEVYIRYGPQCPQTCEWFNRQCTLRAASRPGCFCQPGYVRDNNGNCVLGTAFCGNCSQFQEYLNPGPNCDTECSSLGKPCEVVYIKAPVGCYCLPGYARDAKRNCIPIEDCKSKFILKCFKVYLLIILRVILSISFIVATTCPLYEEYYIRGACDGDCDDPFTKCPKECRPAGCYCKTGYVRHNGKCVAIERCPGKNINIFNLEII